MHLTQLRQTQEEMKTKESRWGASLAQYCLRIETLETQNKELQHVMEQEWLKQWPLQVWKWKYHFPKYSSITWYLAGFISISSNQIEKHYPDGRNEVIFSDGTVRCVPGLKIRFCVWQYLFQHLQSLVCWFHCYIVITECVIHIKKAQLLYFSCSLMNIPMVQWRQYILMDIKRQGTHQAGLESKTRMVTSLWIKLKSQKDNRICRRITCVFVNYQYMII